MRIQNTALRVALLASVMAAVPGEIVRASELMQTRETVALHRNPAKDSEPVAQLAIGERFHVERSRDGWLAVKQAKNGVSGWMPERSAEPIDGCHVDGDRQLDFMLKHHGAIAFNEAYQEFGEGRMATRGVTAGHRTHTRKSLRDALGRYLPDTLANDDTALLLPYVGPTALCLLVVDVRGVRAYAVNRVSAAEVEDAADVFIEHIAPKHRKALRPDCELDTAAPLQGSISYNVPPDRLARLLLPPEIEQSLANYKNIIIVPHGMLAIVPFGALQLDHGKSSFIERFAITVAPGLTQVGIAAGLHRPAPRTDRKIASIVIGDPTFGVTCPDSSDHF